MIRVHSCAFVVLLVLIGAGAALATNSSAAKFSADIAPILMSECLTCHSAEKAKGGYRVHNFAAVLQPGKSKRAVIVPGKPEESEVFKRLTTHDEDDRMPQDDDPLSAGQIELFREWIAAGAKLDRGGAESPLASLVPKAGHPVPPEFYRATWPVLAVAFTADGQELATGGYHEVLFWNLSGELQARVTNAPQRVHSIAFDPVAGAEKRRFAVAGGKPGRSGEVSVYEKGAVITNLVLSADENLAVAFSPDGELLAAGGADNAIRIFRTADWSLLNTIQQHADWVMSVEFNSAGTKVLSASRDRTARVYDAESGELETTFTGHGAGVFAAAFLSDEIVASGGKEKSIHLWDLKEGKKQKDFSEAAGEIYAIVAGGEFFFTAGADGKARQYSTKDRRLVRTFSGNGDLIYALTFDAVTGKLAGGTYRGVVNIWNVADGKLERTFVAAPLRSDKVSVSSAEAAAQPANRE